MDNTTFQDGTFQHRMMQLRAIDKFIIIPERIQVGHG